MHSSNDSLFSGLKQGHPTFQSEWNDEARGKVEETRRSRKGRRKGEFDLGIPHPGRRNWQCEMAVPRCVPLLTSTASEAATVPREFLLQLSFFLLLALTAEATPVRGESRWME